ncbi:hypothetical protein GOODEAATRI_031735, partial [Goodea atripinnis]
MSQLLKEVFQLETNISIDRSHRTASQRRAGDKPRVIIARLHNDGPAVWFVQAKAGTLLLLTRLRPVSSTGPCLNNCCLVYCSSSWVLQV